MAVLAVASAGGLCAAESPVSFSKDIKPILEARCLKCHGAAMQLAKLDLRTRESALMGGDKGPAFVAGKAEISTLFRRVAGLEKPAMPMDGALSATEVEAIRAWINQNAPWESSLAGAPETTQPLAALEDMEIPEQARKYWAFQKPVKPPAPVIDGDTRRHPVDAFLLKAMRGKGLTPAPRADRNTLVRRAYLDLIGLPPAPEEVSRFSSDTAPGAWERLIERLLASPNYGERWGRHWLDVARYADSNGYEHDFDRPNAWRYRDYVIRSFNRDTPYNVFLAEQLAGDELDWVTDDTLIATGFLRNYAKVGFREKDNPQFRFDYLDDMLATVGRGILGITVQCARCHNHKFDPVPQKDYYRLQASLWGLVEVDHPLVPAAEAAAHQAKIDEIGARTAPLQAEIRELERPFRETLAWEKYKRFPANVQEAIRTPEEKRTPGQVLLANQVIRSTSVASAEIERVMKPEELARRKRLADEIKRIEAGRPSPIPVAMGITDGDYRFTPDGAGDEAAPGKGQKREVEEGSFLHAGPGQYQPPPSHFLHHGDMHSRGSLMTPGFLTVATYGTPRTEAPQAHGRTSGRRRALAEWLGSTENPLTARVIVNRVWHHHFGRGIVGTLDNFGQTGDRPTHPDLLDWLAVEFTGRGWSLKNLHRLIMTSESYQRSSNFADADNLNKDRDNLMLWRFRQQRLEAEIVRDQILAVAGSLNRDMGGPPVFPKIAPEILASMKNGIWREQEDGVDVWRRSVYVYRKRGLPFPFFEVFDLPDQNLTCGRRNISTVPTQALTMLNNDFVLDQSKRFARRLRELAPADAGEQIDLAYRIALARTPAAEEKSAALSFLNRQTLEDFAHVLLNLNEFVYLR